MTFPRPGDVEVQSIEVAGVPDDTLYLADRLDRNNALLEQLVQATLQQTNPSPALLRFFGAIGATVSNVINDIPRWRAVGLLITPSAANQRIRLNIGTARAFVFDFTTDETRYFPFSEMFDSGVEISFNGAVAFGGDGFWAFILGYPETNVYV